MKVKYYRRGFSFPVIALLFSIFFAWLYTETYALKQENHAIWIEHKKRVHVRILSCIQNEDLEFRTPLLIAGLKIRKIPLAAKSQLQFLIFDRPYQFYYRFSKDAWRLTKLLNRSGHPPGVWPKQMGKLAPEFTLPVNPEAIWARSNRKIPSPRRCGICDSKIAVDENYKTFSIPDYRIIPLISNLERSLRIKRDPVSRKIVIEICLECNSRHNLHLHNLPGQFRKK
ncbi:hypothetical protein ACFL35_18850 [Candidatus Riflebacteria bacterium]